ncbi:hypothetical protein CP967_11190 [Streptomyces nitrosporeus]|uniref:Uncharacterized protein n=1 Tax=Streptomyces nitrosporeus TaxID=28894 RepID=A0A5J6F923_9ACTN|nr:hypothetical protein [Streptomyces nitrosporeus]QEU72483.1 hypothetical protein CP967_11190 [Streptomyces nitrosporeus]GGY77554.1 hypothetical protein GCM10010327_04620 [Streptomyces nitrosporeus]
MLWESISSVVLGLALAWVALRVMPGRLPSAGPVLLAGALGALFGAFLTHSTLGSVHVLATYAGAVPVAAVAVSLLIRPRGRRPVRPAPAR